MARMVFKIGDHFYLETPKVGFECVPIALHDNHNNVKSLSSVK